MVGSATHVPDAGSKRIWRQAGFTLLASLSLLWTLAVVVPAQRAGAVPMTGSDTGVLGGPHALLLPMVSRLPNLGGADGLQSLLFQMHKTTGAVNESMFFDFKVINNTSGVISSYGILAAHTDQGVTADSWHDPLLPGQILSWTDHLNFPNPGTYQVYLGICFASHAACKTGGAPWYRLSPSTAVTIQ